MSELAKLSEKQRYHLRLGELMDGLLTLETAVRYYLYRENAKDAAESWEALTDLPFGKTLPGNAFTNNKSFGELVKEYNATFKTKSSVKKYAVRNSVVSTRNTLAHGRIILDPRDEIPKFVNFSPGRKEGKLVTVDSVITRPIDWVMTMLPEVTQQITRVKAATARQQ